MAHYTSAIKAHILYYTGKGQAVNLGHDHQYYQANGEKICSTASVWEDDCVIMKEFRFRFCKQHRITPVARPETRLLALDV